MRWRKGRDGTAGLGSEHIDEAHEELSAASLALQHRLLNTVRSLEQFSIDLQANVAQLKQVAHETAERLRVEEERDASGP